MVVADLEAGIGTLTRMAPGSAEAVVIVVEPSSKSLEVGRRAAALALGKDLGRVVVVANSLYGDEDLAAVRDAFDPSLPVLAVPYDDAVVAAEREGSAPLDTAPDCPAVRALAGLADLLGPLPEDR